MSELVQPTSEASPIGEAHAGHGACPAPDAAEVLQERHEAIFRGTTLGHLLVAMGHLRVEQLEHALDLQAGLGAPLGEVVVAEGLCSRADVEAAAALQERCRTASLRSLSAAAPHVPNATEALVHEELDGVLREEGACTCGECRASALSLALNSLPPRYVSSPRLLALLIERYRAESLGLIRERIRMAARRVKERAKPHDRQGCGQASAGQGPLGVCPLPVHVVGTHAHLCEGDVRALFGPGHRLTPGKHACRPGRFVARETLHVVGPKGTLEQVRIIGPAAAATRLEATGADLSVLGLEGPGGRDSATLWGPRGVVKRGDALGRIVGHIHVSPDEAGRLGLDGGEPVSVRIRGRHARTLHGVAVRIAPGAGLELHLPADQGPAKGPPADLILSSAPKS